MMLTALEFLSRWLLDRDSGGVYGASDPSGGRLLSTDKHLPDQASAVLALAEGGSGDDLLVAVEGLLRMQDLGGHPGFCEFTDRHWRPYPAGRVRTVRYQLHAAAALLAAAHRLDLDESRIRAVDLINRCLELARDGEFPGRVTEDWRGVLAGPPTSQTAVSAVRALAVAAAAGEAAADYDALGLITKRLMPMAEMAGASHPPPELRQCAAMAGLAHALAHSGRILGASGPVAAAESVMRVIADRFGSDGGYWDRITADGSVQVDWIEAPHLGQCPFPVMRAADAAQMLLAGTALAGHGVDCSAVTRPARAILAELGDAVHGGFFLARGFQWATPADPVFTAAQLRWSPPAGPGLGVTGAVMDVSLVQKATQTQAAAARALGQIAASVPARGAPPRRTVRRTVRIARGAAGPSPAWRVPEAFREVAVHVLTSGAGQVRERLIAAVRAAQGPDGGFAGRPGATSTVEDTYRAVLALRWTGRQPARPSAVAGFLRRCQGGDGSFGAVPGMAGDVGTTGLAVAALDALGQRPDAVADCVRFILGTRTEDGGYANRRGHRASSGGTHRAIAALLLLGSPVPDAAATAGWLQSLQLPPGGFACRPGGEVSSTGTGHAVAALALLGRAPRDIAACVRWLTMQRDPLTGPPGEDGLAIRQAHAIVAGNRDVAWVLTAA